MVEDKFHFQIPVPENTPFTLSLPFSDSIDEQHIASVTKTGRDQDLFSITEPYQIEKYLDTNPIYGGSTLIGLRIAYRISKICPSMVHTMFL